MGGPGVSSRAGSFRVTGSVGRPGVVTVAELRSCWRQHRAEVAFECATDGRRRHVFEGPLLREVVDAAGPEFGAGRKARSRHMVVVAGGDGHLAVVSWAEVDPDFGDAPMLLAVALDDAPLDACGTQLVVPRDRCGARYVSAVTSVWFGSCASPVDTRGTPRT